MTDQEIIEWLNQVQQGATEMGHKHIQDLLPIKIADFGKAMQPFIAIEVTCKREIKRLTKKSNVKAGSKKGDT